MIPPVERHSVFESIHLSPDFSPQKSSVRMQEDSIRFGKKKSFVLIETLKNFMETVWNWVKYNIFFFVFDEEEEERKELEEEIKGFIDLYFNSSVDETPNEEKKVEEIREEMKTRVVEAYTNLSKNIRERIEKEILKILEEVFPDREQKKYQKGLKKILLEDPYAPAKDTTKPIQQQEMRIMGEAIVRVRTQVMGFSEEQV